VPSRSEGGDQPSSQRANARLASYVPRLSTDAADTFAQAEAIGTIDRLLAQQTSAPRTAAAKAGRDAIVNEEPVIEWKHEVRVAAVMVKVREACGDNDVNPRNARLGC